MAAALKRAECWLQKHPWVCEAVMDVLFGALVGVVCVKVFAG